ncbi:MAG: CpaF family protein [Burkholderiaceae bacterium]|nr:CpaF family protein [Burkholderiaceae bacterium]
MTLREKLAAADQGSDSVLRDEFHTDAFRALSQRLYHAIFERIDLERLQQLSGDEFKRELSLLIERILDDENLAVNQAERRRLVQDMQNEMTGLGPIEPLMSDHGISDILVNSHRQVYVERKGRLELTPIQFHDDAHVMRIIEKIVSRVGRRIDESSPMVDARLEDGSRVNAIIAPLALDGPVLSIRRFAAQPLTIIDLIAHHTLTPQIAELLEALGEAKVNILISGGTGSGKTTLLNVMSAFIPASERIITIEDAAELQLQQPHVVRLETRPPNIEGKGEVSQRSLVKNALRMRPDRIILGEVRGAEALDMLQAMNTGHEGSLATIHANTPRDALSRLENMIGMAGGHLGLRAMRQQIASAVTVVIQLMRQTDGSRKLISLQEITGMEGDIITMQEIFGFRRTGVTAEGKVRGYFTATGICPQFDQRLREFGVPVPEAIYLPSPALA